MKKKLLLSDVLQNVAEELLKTSNAAKSRKDGGVMQFEECEIEYAIAIEIDAKDKVNVFAVAGNHYGYC